MPRSRWLPGSLFAMALWGLHPAPVHAQSVMDLLQVIQQGGSWVGIPIDEGVGSLTTLTVPTGGMSVAGCLQVYPGHSGRWELRVRDALGDGRLDVAVTGGEPVPFSYRTGARAQLIVDARWSEARDTTLLVWVGLETPSRPDRDACEPVYASGR